jgi:lanthanide-dependent methanol dehydrogenase
MKYRKRGFLAGGLIAALSLVTWPVMAEESASAGIDQRAKDPNQWPAPGRDNQLTRHSELKDINTGNVNKLETSTGALLHAP